MTRGVSTVLDASVCLLLVSASALALAGVPTDDADPDPDTADATAEALSSSTARVTAGGGSAHGTLAGLLAAAAVRNATLDGSRLAPDRGFERAAERRVSRALQRAGTDAQVVARWEPFPGSRLGGRAVAGRTPPPDADVHAAALSVPSGLPGVRANAVAAAHQEGFGGAARAVARGVVRGLFPPAETRTALRARSARADRAASRYATAARAVGAESAVQRPLRTGNAARANRVLADALAVAIEPSLRETFDAPTAAARTAAVGRVRVTVRTWSR